jgi:predicted anti-sigma-YlaC factor YlaD
MDLIALYKDGVASIDSRRAIREHLKSCPECARAFAAYSVKKPEIVKPEHILTEDDITANYTKLAKNLRRKHIISTATVIAIVAISIGIGSFSTMKLLTDHSDDEDAQFSTPRSARR